MKEPLIVNLYYGNILQNTIDANLHPEKQRENLKSLLLSASLNNLKEVDIYCNSPYVQFYLTVIHAYVNSNIPAEDNPFSKIVPFENKHFEIKENGEIIEGIYYNGMMSDECLLNDYLGKSNHEYAEYLELEDKYTKN